MKQLILGPPGTGKTTTLLNLIDAYLSKGVEPKKIGFISFTRKSVNEARDRAAARFDKPIDWFYYFRTIHSLSFRQLTMSSSQVMQRNHYIDMGKIMGMKITGIHRQDQMVYEMNKGDQMVFIESLARLTCRSLKDTWNNLNSDISIEELDYFRASLIKYKKANLLFDFTDMLEKYYVEGYKPDLDVLFVDEAQDLCRLQWNIVNQLSEKSKDIYIAGDDDQAIFRWSGADVNYFLGLSNNHETKILSQSYRLPATVFKFSHNIVTQIEKRNIKKFVSTEVKGNVDYINDIDDINLDNGEWLILVRNGFMIRDIVDYLRICGYSYETTYYSITEDETLKAALNWEKLKLGKKILVTDAKIIIGYMSFAKLGFRNIKNKNNDDEINMTEFIKETLMLESSETSKQIWHEALDKISIEDREYYIATRRKGESLINKPRIKVSTIHGAKGGEAENVVVYTDMSVRTYNNMMENYDDELRVFYVAITRAKKNLFIVQPKTPNYFSL
jgi:DNA helicase-2/ATP-dependent DNA helicase PcrA